MKLLILSILTLFSTVALADFYKPDKVPANLKPQGFDRGRAAALEIEPTGDELGCSATIVSSYGHVLTALHCIPKCVKLNTVKSIKSFQYRTPDRQYISARKATCSLPFAQEGRRLGNLKAEVVAAGVGYVLSSDAKNLAKELDKYPERRTIYSRIIEAGVGVPGDFAILLVPALANRTCAKSAASAPNVAEAIWNIAYPATKTGAVFSYGQVTYALKEKANYEVKTGAAAAALRVQRNGMFISNIDSNEGSSGSGVQSYQGLLVGVLNAADKSMKGGRYSSSIDYIKQYTGASFGASVLAQSFNCQ